MARHARQARAATAAEGEPRPVMAQARLWIRRAALALAVAAGAVGVYVALQVTAPFRSPHRPAAALPAHASAALRASEVTASAPVVPQSPDAEPTPPAASGTTAAASTATAGGTTASRPAAGTSRATSPVTRVSPQNSSTASTTGQTVDAAQVAPALSGPPTQPPPALQAPVTGAVLAAFGWAYSPVFADWQEHAGVDLASPVGGTAVAPGAGVVLQVRQDTLWGWVVSIDLGGGYSTNVSGLERVSVHAGQAVRAGEPIGTVGAAPPAEADLAPHVFWQLFAGATPLNPLGG